MSASDLAIGRPFPVGVNYWPRRKAMWWWKEFERDEVAEEFDVIARLGLRLVRIFLLWEDFQPRPDSVAPAALDDLEVVCDVAAEAGLGLDVTFFTGHMSGPNWAPAWLLGGEEPVAGGRQVVSGANLDAGPYRNPYTDPMALDAAELQLREVVGRLRGHRAVWAWNLGNEPDNFALPPDDASAVAWAERMFAVIAGLDPERHRTVGLHAPSLSSQNHLRADQLFRMADLAVMHAYPIYANFGGDFLDPDVVPFATALTAALSGRPTMMEEFGACTSPPGSETEHWQWRSPFADHDQVMLSEEVLAEHVGEVLPRLVEVGAVGAMVWCFADYHQSLWQRPPCDHQRHERHFGLVRPDGSLKPHAQAIRAFIESRPLIAAPSTRARMDVDGPSFYEHPAERAAELFAVFGTADGSSGAGR
jgi:endo-1,4-beta-mannosidase